MSAYVVRTNKLCATCIYLPSEDLQGTDERQTVLDLNDLCGTCINNCKTLAVRALNEDERDIQDRVHANSRYLKDNGGVSP